MLLTIDIGKPYFLFVIAKPAIFAGCGNLLFFRSS